MGIQERKEREKEHRREEILDAAQKVFFEKGLQVSTMDEIAEAAELSKGTLYLYYKSKEDLYLAVMIRGMETLCEMFERTIATGKSSLELLNDFGQTYYEFFRLHPNYFRMLHFFQNPIFHKQVSEEMMEHCSRENQKIWKLVIGVIERGISEGMLRSDLAPGEMAVILWLNSNAILVRMDTQREHFKELLEVDLEQLLWNSNALMLESVMTEKARKMYASLIAIRRENQYV